MSMVPCTLLHREPGTASDADSAHMPVERVAPRVAAVRCAQTLHE